MGVAHGLTYLHQCDLVHGNLTGVTFNIPVSESKWLITSQDNILVDCDGVAGISKYDLEVVLPDEASLKSIPTNVRRRTAEVPGTSDRRIQSKVDGRAADVYSFTMIAFEVTIPCFHSQLRTASQPSHPGLFRDRPVPPKK